MDDYKKTQLYKDMQAHFAGMTQAEIDAHGMATINSMRAELGQKPLTEIPRFDENGNMINFVPPRSPRVSLRTRLSRAWRILTSRSGMW